MAPVKTVDDYLASKPPPVRAVLRQVRAAVRKAAPKALEIISYQMPAAWVPEGILVYFAGWTDHYSLYPVGPALIAKLGAPAKKYESSNKGTIRFPLDGRVPGALISRIVKLRAAEVAERAEARRAAKKKKARVSHRRTRAGGGSSRR
ncbi:MAG: hypothetical protein AMXMBFR34_34150 [Myxococcaceae bacterium]